MRSATDLQTSIQASSNGITLAELLAQHPSIARRTAQRLIAKLIESELVNAQGEGRARRYFPASAQATVGELSGSDDIFPNFIPVSADSKDILTYIEQALIARKPVGYQKIFWIPTALMKLGIYPIHCAVSYTKWVKRQRSMSLQERIVAPFLTVC